MNARALSSADRLAASDAGQRRATLELSIGRLPDGWGFLICSGIATLVNLLERAAPSDHEIQLLRDSGSVRPAFADLLRSMPCSVDLNVPPEGTLLFPGDPLVTIEGPLWQAWLFAEAARTVLRRDALVATRAARLCLVAGSTPLVDGTSCNIAESESAVAIARAAHVGGAAATLCPSAAVKLGVRLRVSPAPDAVSLAEGAEVVRGAAWSYWTTAGDLLLDLGPGDDEEETLRELRGMEVHASAWCARGLDRNSAGLVIRCDLVALEQQGVWTSRLGAVHDLSVNPGRKLVVRYVDADKHPIADVMHGVTERIQQAQEAVLVGHVGSGAELRIDGAASGTPLLTSVLRSGRRVGSDDPLAVVRQRVNEGLAALAEPYKRLRHPATFPVGLSPALARLKADLVAAL